MGAVEYNNAFMNIIANDVGNRMRLDRLSSSGPNPASGDAVVDITDEKEPFRPNGIQYVYRKSVQLYKYQDAPHFLQGNPFIHSGYMALLTHKDCFRSLLMWSNESVNTWSHLLGFLLFFILMVWDNIQWIPKAGGSLADHAVISIGLICFQFCMLCSAGYHLFRSHSERANNRWLAMDLTGISIGLLGCYLPGVHYAFYCLSVWRDIYLMIIGCLFASVLFYQTQSRYYGSDWFRRRVLLYCGLAGYGVVPTLHWIKLSGGFSANIVQEFAPKVAVVYILGLLAFFFYASKFPERTFPGKFDLIGSSHQLWHLVVVVAFLWWHYSGQSLLLYRLQHQCEL